MEQILLVNTGKISLERVKGELAELKALRKTLKQYAEPGVLLQSDSEMGFI